LAIQDPPAGLHEDGAKAGQSHSLKGSFGQAQGFRSLGLRVQVKHSVIRQFKFRWGRQAAEDDFAIIWSRWQIAKSPTKP
jgi:hypothetical protein